MQHNGRDIEVGDAVLFTEADQAAGPVMCPGRVGMGIVQSVDNPVMILEHWPAAPAA